VSALRAVAALLAVLALGIGTAACGPMLFPASSVAGKPESCTIQLNAQPSAVGILLHRDSASSRAELNAILLTASPDEYFFLFKAATGKLVGSFKTPPGPVLPGPMPPAPLPSDPTQVQTHTYSQEIATYDSALRRDRAHLRLRWLTQLITWASQVMSRATAHRDGGPYLDSEVRGLVRGLSAATASITSLNHIPGVHLGTRIILAILGLQQVPATSPPQLTGGLLGATVVVTGFTGTSGQEITWRKVLARAGADGTVVLTPSTGDELPAVVEPVLSRGNPPLAVRQVTTAERSCTGRSHS
jgi:hypothetical protein